MTRREPVPCPLCGEPLAVTRTVTCPVERVPGGAILGEAIPVQVVLHCSNGHEGQFPDIPPDMTVPVSLATRLATQGGPDDFSGPPESREANLVRLVRLLRAGDRIFRRTARHGSPADNSWRHDERDSRSASEPLAPELAAVMDELEPLDPKAT